MLFRVQDTGMGISLENQKLVFQKYKQVGDFATDKPKGTGLGLPISKHIVEQHGGRIWVESTLGEGSTFCFTLPLATIVHPNHSSIAFDELQKHLNTLCRSLNHNPKVLIVDDEKEIRNQLKQRLKAEEFEIFEAVDGQEGFETARKIQPDIILLDVMMPNGNGFDCAASVQSNSLCRHIPILMLTVVNDAQRVYGLAIEKYINKPFDPTEVLTAMKEIIHRQPQQRQVVVLGSDAQQIFDLLQSHNFTWITVSTIGELHQAVEEQNASLAIVTDTNYQTLDKRLEISTTLGPTACFVVYFTPETEDDTVTQTTATESTQLG